MTLINKPDKKYPIQKCLDFMQIQEELNKFYHIDLYNIPCESSKYGKENFYTWMSKELKPIFPKIPSYSIMGREDYKDIIDWDSVYNLPYLYDSSNDYAKWVSRKISFKKNMENITGKSFNDDNDKHINYGPQSNEWVNIALRKIYEIYSEYYDKYGNTKIWISDEGFTKEKSIYDYPFDKSYILSDIENWIKDTFDINTSEFYQWIIDCQYVEGRYWENVWMYDISDISYMKKECSDDIKNINEILKQIYKVSSIPIYIDYFKKIKIQF